VCKKEGGGDCTGCRGERTFPYSLAKKGERGETSRGIPALIRKRQNKEWPSVRI